MPNFTTPKGELQFKRLDIKAKTDSLADNEGKGTAACIGNMDRGGDVIFPGAFTKTAIKGFLKSGFIALGHDWTVPIGMPLSAAEVGNELTCSWKYHTTEGAQEARTVALERLAAGLDVGLSIGFAISYPDGRVWFENSEQLLKYAKDNGFDLTLFDTKSIKAWSGMCRGILKVEELFEFSQVTVPMNPSAIAAAVKGLAADVCSDEPESKSQSTTLGGILQAKIHQAFTVAADELAVRGYLDTDERIAISSNIGDALKLFRSLLDPEIAARSVDAADVDRIASKQADPPPPSDSIAEIDAVTRALALKSQTDYVMATL